MRVHGTEHRGATLTDTASVLADTSDMAPVHKVFRDSLAMAPELIASAAGNSERRAMIANYYANLMAFLGVHHDGEEQLVFPLLAERVPEHKSVVERALRQHEDVVGLLHAANDQIAAWEEKGDPEAPGLVRALADLADTLIPHLDLEEADVVPLCATCITVEEWGALPGHAMARFQGDKVWLIMGLIRENFTQAQRDQMLEHMPPPARQMWETMGERSFNELIGQVRAG